MFQLIVAVISIALVAALAIASIYYGGQAFQKSALKANVTTLVNAGQQISGAQALYRTDLSVPALALSSLLADAGNGTYLSAAPSTNSLVASGGAWALDATGTYAEIAVNSTSEVIGEVNKQATGTVSTTAKEEGSAQQFGVNAAGTFWFKL